MWACPRLFSGQGTSSRRDVVLLGHRPLQCMLTAAGCRVRLWRRTNRSVEALRAVHVRLLSRQRQDGRQDGDRHRGQWRHRQGNSAGARETRRKGYSRL